MFCPRCSQEQPLAEMKYCSRCGLPLIDIAEALACGGYLDRNAGEVAGSLRRSVLFGLIVMAASFIFLIVSLILGTPEPSFVVQWNLFVAIAFFIGGIVWGVYTLARGTRKRLPQMISVDVDESRMQIEGFGAALPDSYQAPAAVETTRELDKVPSVAEHTTHTLQR